jgi:hypothetical protein
LSHRITDRDDQESSSSQQEYYGGRGSGGVDQSEKFLNTASLSSTGKRDMNGSQDSQIMIQDNHWDERKEEMKILNSVMSKMDPHQNV